jgi:hypothetical protein
MPEHPYLQWPVFRRSVVAAFQRSLTGYKKHDQQNVRRAIVDSLRQVLSLQVDEARLLECPDVLDATVCLLAAKDFLDGRVILPKNLNKAKREGWIWVSGEERGGSAEPASSTTFRRPGPRDATRAKPLVTADVIRNFAGLASRDVARRRVICPACGQKLFESWPAGWDAHAAHACSALKSVGARTRKEEFKRRFRHLFS